MADELDRASDYEELARSAAIAFVSGKATTSLPTSKKCLECGSKTVGGARWCDAGCRDTYEMRK
jgi:hypothetical protein